MAHAGARLPIVIAAFTLVLGNALAASCAKADPADDYVHRFMARYHAPGVALAIIRDGHVLKAATWGVANLEWKQPLTRTAPFWLDSLTKLFTAVGIMQLAEQKKLGLDDPITNYLADAPAAWRAVTIRHMLAHMSGIRDDYWQLYRGSPLLAYEEKDIYDYALTQPFEFKPGARSQYSNLGYYLLGRIIAKVTGERYTQWITAHVLKPAGMKTARMYDPFAVIPEMVSSYALKDGRVVHNRADILSDRGEAIAGWGLYASLDDMIAFDAALRGGKLVSPQSLEMMWSNARLNSGAPSNAGLGFWGVAYEGGHRIAHKGGQAGVMYSVYPDDRVSVIFLTNLEASPWVDSYDESALAGLYDSSIRALSGLAPRPDNDPARTDKLRAAIGDIAAGISPSPRLTPAMNATVTSDVRPQAKALLAGWRNMVFLGCETPSVHDPYGVAQLCAYRAHMGPGVVDMQFGLARNGLLATIDGKPE